MRVVVMSLCVVLTVGGRECLMGHFRFAINGLVVSSESLISIIVELVTSLGNAATSQR